MISQCLNDDSWYRWASSLAQFQFKIIIYKEIPHGVNQICSGHNFLVIPVSPWFPDVVDFWVRTFLCLLAHIPAASNQIQPLCHHHHFSHQPLSPWCHLLHLSTRSEDLHISAQNFLAAIPWFCEICKIWRVWVEFFGVIILLYDWAGVRMLVMVHTLIFSEEQLFIDRIVDGVCFHFLFLPQTTLPILFSNYLPLVFPLPLNLYLLSSSAPWDWYQPVTQTIWLLVIVLQRPLGIHIPTHLLPQVTWPLHSTAPTSQASSHQYPPHLTPCKTSSKMTKLDVPRFTAVTKGGNGWISNDLSFCMYII